MINRPEQILALQKRIDKHRMQIAGIKDVMNHSSFLLPSWDELMSNKRNLETDIAICYRKIDNLKLGKNANGEAELSYLPSGHATRMPYVD